MLFFKRKPEFIALTDSETRLKCIIRVSAIVKLEPHHVGSELFRIYLSNGSHFTALEHASDIAEALGGIVRGVYLNKGEVL